MVDSIWGSSPASEYASGYSQGQQMAILGAKATEARIKANQELESLAATKSLESEESKYASTHPEADLSSVMGRLQMFSNLSKNPEIRNNPVLMTHVYGEMDQLRAAQSKSAKASIDMQKEEMMRVGDVVNMSLLNPSSPESQTQLKGLISDPNVNPNAKVFLTGLQRILDPNSNVPVPKMYWEGNRPKTYAQLSPEMQQQFNNNVMSHLLTSKDSLAAQSRMAQVAVNQQRAQIAGADEKRKERRDAQQEALSRERIRVEEESLQARLQHMKVTEDHLRDRSPQLAKAIEDRDKALRGIEDKQSKILQSYGISSPDEMQSHWIGKDSPIMDEGDLAAYNKLEDQKTRVIEDYAAKSKMLLKSDQTQGNSGDVIAQTLKAKGLPYEPDKYEYRMGPGGEIQSRKK